MIGIYKVKSPTNKIYIGQSIDVKRRFNTYKWCKGKGQIRLNRSFEKYGVENHIFEIIEECEIEELNIKERYWQDYYNVIGENGLNCTLINTNDLPKIVSEKTKLKMSESGKKNNLDYTERGKKISKSLTGKKLSEDHKKQISISHLGLKQSEEHIYNRFKNKKIKKVINVNTGQIWISSKECSKELNININTLRAWLCGYDLKNNYLKYYAEQTN